MTTNLNLENKSTEEKIKEAALYYISKYGYDGTALNDIAKAVGIKTPSIYSHFESKEQLFLIILKDQRIKERENLFKLVLSFRNKSTKECFKTLFFHYTDTNNIVFWYIALKQILMNPPSDIIQNLREDFIEIEREVSIQLIELFDIGRKEGSIKKSDTDKVVSLFFTLIDGLLVEQNLYGEKMYEKRRQEVWHLYWDFISQ